MDYLGHYYLFVFTAQLADGGGAGSWAIGISGIITLLIAILAYFKKADNSITKADWIFFILVLSAIPFWYIIKNPLWAVIILTTIDTLGMFPTIKKAYVKPFEEQIQDPCTTPQFLLKFF